MKSVFRANRERHERPDGRSGRGCLTRVALRLALIPALLAGAGRARAQEAAPPGPVLTLDAAISEALRNSRVLAGAALDVTRAGERIGEAKSYRWPSLSAKVLASRLLTSIDFRFEPGVFGTYPGVGPIPAQETTISTPEGWATLAFGQLSLPLSQQYRIGLAVKMSEKDEEYYREKLRGECQKTVHDVRRAYYSVLAAESALAAARETRTAGQEVARVVGDRVHADVVLEVDQTEARAQLATAEAAVLTASGAVQTQKESLNQLLGRDVRTGFTVAPVADPPALTADLIAARARALAEQPAARQVRLQADEANLNWKKHKAEYLPSLSFAANYVSPFSVNFLPRNIFAAGFLLDWEIFDGGRRARQAAQAREQAEQARLAALEVEASIEIEVGRQYRALEETRARLSAAELFRSAKRDRMRIAQDRFTQQAIRVEELLRVQADLADAERQYTAALSAYWSARADYDRAIGEDPS